MLPKFFVCTLYCGEPGLAACIRSVSEQQNVEIVEHRIVKNLKEVDAHNVCYQAFNQQPENVIRAKIDADCTLVHTTALAEVAKLFSEQEHLHGISPHVRDYMTNTDIYAGITFFTHHVRFSLQRNSLKCDREIIVDEKDHRLAHASVLGNHMFEANELTAFRYGFHRGLKSQMDIYRSLCKAHAEFKDVIRYYAIRGFEAAQSSHFHDWHNVPNVPVPSRHSYSDAEFQHFFEKTKADITKLLSSPA